MQVSQAQNLTLHMCCMEQFVYIENCLGRSPGVPRATFLTPVLFAIRFLDAQPCTMLVTSLDFPMPARSVIKRLWPTKTNCFTSFCSALRAIFTRKAVARDYPGVAGNFAQSPDHIDQKLHSCIIVASR